MHRRGQPNEVIAELLKVHVRSVSRYLAAPCPEPIAEAEAEVEVASFYMKGACAGGRDIDDWFSEDSIAQARAKAVCSHCPVLAMCRMYGISKSANEDGIWGGLTKEERRRIARARRGTRVDASHQGAA